MSNMAIFFDRDGTLIHDPGYLNQPDQVQVIEGVAEAIREFKLLGYKTVVASNQSGVARGMITVETLEQIHDRLSELLDAQGATLDAIYYCPYHPDGTIPEYRRDSDWRKPQPGMLLAAAEEMDLDLTQSWMIGDSERDIEAGRSAGCRTILIGSYSPQTLRSGTAKPDYVAVNMREAVNIIKRHRRTIPDKREDRPASVASEMIDEQAPVAPEVGDESAPAGFEPNDEQALDAESAAILSIAPEPQVDEPQVDEPEVDEPEDDEPEDISPVEAIPFSLQEYVNEPVPAPAEEARDTTTAPSVVVSAATSAETERLLNGILEQLRRMQKDEMFGEFSLMRLLAGIVQVFAALCLLLAFWFVMSSNRQDSNVLLALGFATVLQVMALTFYTMNSRP